MNAVGNNLAIDVQNASVRVGERTIWSDINLQIVSGSFVAVLGPNGVGKSTLIKAILGLVPLSAGKIDVLGQSPGHGKQHIGYLPQRRSFDPSLRIRGIDIVRLGFDGDRWGLPMPWSGARRRSVNHRIDELLELVDATGYARKPIGECSGGEQQRLLIAQALIQHPSLLLLDEPLDSLDLPNQSAFAALIARICREESVTVMIVAHDVNPILPYIDRVIYLAGGGAVSGMPEEVITNETLSRLYHTNIEVLRTSSGQLVVIGQPEAPTYHPGLHASHGHQ